MSKKIKLTEQQLSALVTEASFKAVLAAQGAIQNGGTDEGTTLAKREAEGSVLEAKRTNLEQAEWEKIHNCLRELSNEVKSLKKEEQKLSKAVNNLEKSDKKQTRELEYAEGYLTDLKHDVRDLNSCVKKLKNQAKESKKILQIFGSIMQFSKPSDDLKTIRKKFTDALLVYKAKLKTESFLPYGDLFLKEKK